MTGINKFLTVIILSIYSLIGIGYAKELEITVKPIAQITTSNVFLSEGDKVDFVVTSPAKFKGQHVYGIVTNLVENSWACYEAKLLIENFRFDDGQKLNGIIYKTGNSHSVLTEFVVTMWIRGGEVQINPEKHQFILYLEEKNEKNCL